MFAGLKAASHVFNRSNGSETKCLTGLKAVSIRDVCRPEKSKTKLLTGLVAVSIRCVCRPTGSKPSSSQA